MFYIDGTGGFIIIAGLLLLVFLGPWILKGLSFLFSLILSIYCVFRWVVLKLLESYGIVEEKPRKVIDIKGLPDFEIALIISVIIGLLLVFLGNKACS